MIQKVFEIGNSIAITIPRKAGIKIGTRVKFSKGKNKLIYEVLDLPANSIKDSEIIGTTGGFDLHVPNLPKVLKGLKDSPYEKINFS